MDNMERELDWNDVIEKDGEDFIVLPAGDYDFEVTGFERGRHGGSEKLPPCNKATLNIKVTATDGQSTTIKHNLFLHSKCEGMLCAFFTGIGQRKHGEKLSMNWNTVVGATGKCKIKVRDWTTKEGKAMQNNEIAKFYEPDESEPTQTGGWKPGAF